MAQNQQGKTNAGQGVGAVSREPLMTERPMTIAQYLDPDIVYRFNALVYDIWDTGNLKSAYTDGTNKDAYVIPGFLSKATRTFHWIAVHHSMFRIEGSDARKGSEEPRSDPPKDAYFKVLNSLREEYSAPRSGRGPGTWSAQWKSYVKDLPDLPRYAQARKDLEEHIKRRGTVITESVHRALLSLYSGFHQSVERNVEGVLYRFLECHKDHSDGPPQYLCGKLHKLAEGEGGYDWLELEKSKCKLCLKPWESLRNAEWSTTDKSSAEAITNLNLARIQSEKQSIASRLLDFVLPEEFRERVRKHPYVALLPLYDQWIRGLGYGGIKGLFVLFFKSKNTRKIWLDSRSARLTGAFSDLAAAVTESAETLALSSPIKSPYDLITHFLKILSYVQDWESAVVFRDKEFVFGYHRTKPKQNSTKWNWSLSSKNGSFHDLDVNEPNEEISGSDARDYIWWTTKLWSEVLIPSLQEEERSAFGKLAIRFEFPKVAQLPDANRNTDGFPREALREAYLRQQLEVMRRLIPDIRARRSALRNAAVSIMARNMSHNIGSHVLAAARNDSSIMINELHRLSEHLQRRMDFIAELATVEALSAADNLLLHDVFGVSPGTEVVINGEAGDQGRGLNAQKLLLRHISGAKKGKQFVGAMIHVRFDKAPAAAEDTRDANVSFNSGVLGWQAVYVILENIIRNVAKHARKPKNGKGTVKSCLDADAINIYLKWLNAHDEFFEVRIWDGCGTASDLVGDRKDTTVIEYLAQALKQPRFLDDDNAVVTKDWGMKEMYISAAFLRGIALSDLEGHLPVAQPEVIQACPMDVNGGVRSDSVTNGSQTGPTAYGHSDKYGNIGFRLWLPKAKSVAIIVDNVAEWRQSFGSASKNGENCEAERIEKTLKDRGVDFFSVETACAAGKRVPHRYGVLLSKDFNSRDAKKALDERRAELPLDLVENEDGLADELAQFLQHGEVDKLILYVRKRVLEKRRKRVALGNGFGLWTCNAEITPGTPCGKSVSQLELEAFKSAVVFDWHGDGLGATSAGLDGESNLNRWRQAWPMPGEGEFRRTDLSPKEVIDEFAFYESHRGAFPQTGLFPSLSAKSPEVFQEEVLCAALTPVLIMDERFQRIAAQRSSSVYLGGAIASPWRDDRDTRDEEFKMGKIWQRMRVYVPFDGALAGDCDLEQPKLKEILVYLGNIEMKLGLGAFLVVHQTIFEKLGPDGNELDKYLANKARNHGWVNVVCSGRGVPWQLQGKNHDTAYRPRFISLSALLQCLEHMPSKLHLIRLLEVTRAPCRT